MKKTLKKLSFAAALLMCFAIAVPAFAPIAKIYAEPTTSFITAVEEIKIENFQETATKGEVYQIATGTVTGGQATVTVKNPQGGVVTVTGNAFTPAYAGNYTVTYTHGNVSTDMTVKVSGVTQGTEIAFDKNNEYIIPSVINPKSGSVGLKLTLPNPYVVDKDGEKIEDATVTTTVSFSGEGTDYVFTSDAVTLADGTKLDTLQLDKAREGTYTITYKYMVEGKLVAFTTKTIKADLSYNNDFEFTFDYEGTKPTTAEIGKETKLPKITAKNKTTKNAVEVYYAIKAVTKIGDTTYTYTSNDTNNDVITFKNDYFYFTPIKDGDYVITYTVKNLFGKEASVSSSSFELTNVKDSTAPTPVATLPYTASDITNGVLDYVDATEAIVSNGGTENIIMLPIWATDNANGIVADNLKLYRTLTKSTSTTVLFDESKDITENVAGKILVFNSTLDMTGADTSEVMVIYVNGKSYSVKKSDVYVVSKSTDEKALKSGTYTMTYVANDKAGNGVVNKPYSVKITSGFEDKEKPTVKFVENLPNAVFIDEEVNFATPTATDTTDSHLSVYVAYTTTVAGEEQTEVRADADGSLISFDKDTKTYTLKVSSNLVEKVKVTAYSRDDSGNIGKAEQTIVILKTGDTRATTVVSRTTNINQTNGFVQGAEITLPTVVYNDDLVDYVNVEILISNPSTPNLFKAYDAEIIRDSGSSQITVKDAKFVPSLAGDYTIKYITTDAANNKTIVAFTVAIEANLADLVLEFKGLPSEINSGKAERGEVVKLDIPTLDLSNTSLKLKNGTYYVKVKGPTGYRLDSNYFFTPNEIGTYRLQYVAEVLNEDNSDYETVTSKEFKIEVADTVGPAFTDFADIQSFFAEKNANGSVDKGTTLDLPLPQTMDADIDWATSNVVVSTNNNAGIPYYLNQPEDLEDYRFSRDATYTITYTLVDIYGNQTKQTATLDVGDVEPPKITVSEGLFKGEYKIGDTINVDLSKISAIDKVDGKILIYNETTKKYSIQDNATIKITVKNTTTGTEVANDVTSTNSDLNFQYTIKTAGEYTVAIAISDTTGKTGSYDDISFSVGENANNGMSAEEILGTVLIIISVLLLVGVIAYFIISKKKLEKKMK